MTEALKNKVRDGEILDVSDETQCAHWSAEFGIGVEELRRAALEAGYKVADVKAYFSNRENRAAGRSRRIDR